MDVHDIAPLKDPSELIMEKNSLHLNDNSVRTHSTQLDIEGSENSSSNNLNDEGFDVIDDDGEDLPPLSTYLSGWKFWCKFAIWPFVFFTLNAIIVFTLVAFNEYEFQYGKRQRHHRSYMYPEDFDMGGSSRSSSNVRYEMMKYNRMVILILLFIDALIVYYSATFLEKKVRELDMIGSVDDAGTGRFPPSPGNNGSSVGILTPNVHAQVSRKLDAVLGRSSQCRVSILVSILWLLFVSCGTVGLVSVADLLFAISPKGKSVCTSKQNSSQGGNSSSSNSNNNNDDDAYGDLDYNRTKDSKPIEDIPDGLQDWAKSRHSSWDSFGNIIHLKNGVTYFVAYNPGNGSNDNDPNEFMGYEDKRQLVSAGSDGSVTFYDNVKTPFAFSSFYSESPLNATSFCCVYTGESDKKTPYEMDYYAKPIMLLCTGSNNKIVDGIFPNVTIYKQDPEPKRGFMKNFEGASLKSYQNELWLQLTTRTYDMHLGNEKTTYQFYKVVLGEKLEINPITHITFSGYDYRYGDGSTDEFGNPFLLGPGSACYRWTRNIDLVVFLFAFGTASIWLMHVKNLSVGIVPAVAAVAMSFTRLNHGFSLAMCSIAAVAAIIGLLDCIRIPMSREKLVWVLYTLQFWIAGLIFSGSFYMYYDSFTHFSHALVMIITASFIGFILNHPVLFLFGWIGGIWAVFCGFFLSFTPYSHHQGLFAIFLGIIMGAGCVTVGFNLIQYRAHFIYYSKRAWYAMNSAMQQANSNPSSGGHRRSNTTSNTRYTAVLRGPQDSPIRAPAPVGKRENDIRSGLLNHE